MNEDPSDNAGKRYQQDIERLFWLNEEQDEDHKEVEE